MASLGSAGEGGAREELKSQFSTREGTYRLASAVEFSRTTRPLTYVPPANNTTPAPGTSPPIRISFVTNAAAAAATTTTRTPHLTGVGGGGDADSLASNRSSPGSSSASATNNTMVHRSVSDYHPPTSNNGSSGGGGSATGSSHEETNPDAQATPHRFCLNIGKELFVYPYMGTRKAVDMSKPMDKRIYKGTNPTCHDFNPITATQDSLRLLIGFSGGQIQLVDPISKEVNKLYNEERVVDKTRVTCIRWVPNSTSLFLVSHSSGHIYLYNVEHTSGTAAPNYQVHKTGPGFTISTCKSKTPRNPILKWTLGEGAINEFAFSPCGQHLAVVSQDGFLRIFKYDSYELVGVTRSYFGGLLCVCWSPDGKYVCVGGEDDLVTMWSFKERRVVARGQGHKSWVSVVAFDPVTTTYSDSDITEDFVSAGDQNCCGSCVKCQHSDLQSSGVFSCDSVGTGSTLIQNSTCLACQQTNSGKPQSLVNIVNNNSSTTISGTNATNNITLHTCVPSFPRSSRQSRTSESMRLSLSEPTNARIPACYRVGSVGQDTQICLWDLTEDVLKQPFGKSRPSCRTPGRNGNLSDTSPCAIHSNSKLCKSHLYHHQNNLPNCNTSSASSNCATASKSHSDKEDSSNTIVGNNVNSSSATGSGSTVNLNVTSPTSNAVSSTTNGTASSQPLTNSSGHSHGILSLRFGALSFGGDKEKSKDKDSKEHKRNFSLGSSSNKSEKNSSSGSNSKSSVGPASGLAALGLNIDKLDDPLKLIGTQACPRLDECPLLEPLICKKISHERLTTLIFRDESIVTACQDGIVCTWARPGDAVSQL